MFAFIMGNIETIMPQFPYIDHSVIGVWERHFLVCYRLLERSIVADV